MTVIQEYLVRLRVGLCNLQRSLAERTYCFWMRTAHGNGPPHRPHLCSIPARRSFARKWYLVTCPLGELAAVSCLEHSCSKGQGKLNGLLQVCSSTLTNNHHFLFFYSQKNNFIQVKQPQTSQGRTMPWGWVGEGSPHSQVKVWDPSSALCHWCFPRNPSGSKSHLCISSDSLCFASPFILCGLSQSTDAMEQLGPVKALGRWVGWAFGAGYIKGVRAIWTSQRNASQWWETQARIRSYNSGFLQLLSWCWIYWEEEAEMARNKNNLVTNMPGEAALIISQKAKICSSSSSLFNTGTVL